jgi:hypothetical protein
MKLCGVWLPVWHARGRGREPACVLVPLAYCGVEGGRTEFDHQPV